MKEVQDNYEKAGFIAMRALKYGESLIKKGVVIPEILDLVEQKIVSLGGGIAFPAQISLNNVAAHQCSDDYNEVIPEGYVKLDVGAHVDGFIGDNALTVCVDVDDSLAKASRSALDKALKVIKPGVLTKDVGRVIEDEIKRFGFEPVMNLSGHGLGQFVVHSKPSMPNVEVEQEVALKEGDVVAIEPFASTGSGIVSAKGNATVFTLVNEKSVRSNFTREVLKRVKTYKGLPFTTRWLEKEFGKGKTSFAVREMLSLGMLESHPPLEDKNGFVSQAEHTIIVKKDKSVITTRWQE